MLKEARTTGLTSGSLYSTCWNFVPILHQYDNCFPLENRFSKCFLSFLKSCKIKCDNECKTSLKSVNVCVHTREVSSHIVYEAKT